MSDCFEINGAIMDRAFFEDNVSEAKSYNWEKVDMNSIKDHSHCLICTIALPNEGIFAYKSDAIYLCSHCYHSYVKPLKFT